MKVLQAFIRQWQRDAWNAVDPKPKPMTPGEAIGAAGAQAAELGLRVPEAWRPFLKDKDKDKPQ